MAICVHTGISVLIYYYIIEVSFLSEILLHDIPCFSCTIGICLKYWIMSSSFLSTKDKETLNRFISGLCLQSTQIIVQGRIGKPISTQSVPSSVGTKNWIPFNLAIKDFPEVRHQAVAALSNGLPSSDNTYVIEVSLRTSDADALVLEVWSIGLTNKCEDEFYESMVYDHILLLLKSLLCISRTTPAYKLSRRQGNEYVICYRVYMGKISLNGLGEGFKTLKVGTVTTPVGTVAISAAYRTTENLHVSTERLSPGFDLPFDVQEDHFSLSRQPVTSPARPCVTLKSRLRTLSETSEGLVENSPSFNTFNVSHSKSSRRRASDKDDENVKFTVGTPPSGQTLINRSATSPNLTTARNRNPSSSPRQQGKCLPTCGNGFHSVHCGRLSTSSSKSHHRKNTSIPEPGSSAPSLRCFYKPDDVTVVDSPGANRRTSIPRINPNRTTTAKTCHQSDQKRPNFPAGSETAHHRWSNSNVTKVTARGSANSMRNLIAHNSSKNGQGEWGGSALSVKDKYANNSPPALETGAFVLGGKTRSKAKSSATPSPCDLPFLDLISALEDEDSLEENMSQESDSSPDTSPDRKSESENGKENLPIKSGDGCTSSGLSSKQSRNISNTETLEKRAKDDFVMVDLSPAFARDESIEDLSTFYKECKNAPDLVMFEEQKENAEETMMDLSKRIEDYQNEIVVFDQFVNEITNS